jgi:hypothetical protein
VERARIHAPRAAEGSDADHRATSEWVASVVRREGVRIGISCRRVVLVRTPAPQQWNEEVLS